MFKCLSGVKLILQTFVVREINTKCCRGFGGHPCKFCNKHVRVKNVISPLMDSFPLCVFLPLLPPKRLRSLPRNPNKKNLKNTREEIAFACSAFHVLSRWVLNLDLSDIPMSLWRRYRSTASYWIRVAETFSVLPFWASIAVSGDYTTSNGGRVVGAIWAIAWSL